MSFYTEHSSSIGTCDACGSPVAGGGQSGPYCTNNACVNGWLGGRTREQIDAERRAARLRAAGWYRLEFTSLADLQAGERHRGSAGVPAPSRPAAIEAVKRWQARGWKLDGVSRISAEGKLVDVDDDLTGAC